jgi:hypothetical protein
MITGPAQVMTDTAATYRPRSTAIPGPTPVLLPVSRRIFRPHPLVTGTT